MHRLSTAPLAALAALGLGSVTLAGCDLFGSKQDATTDEIFDQGKTDPNAVSDVGYVPVQPFFTQGSGAAFTAPRDVYVGFDGFVYVVDARGLHVLDRAGRPQALFETARGQALTDAGCVIQDRRFHVYVCARRDTTVEGRARRLPVVYRISGLTTGTPQVEDVIWHPFDDLNRALVQRNPIDTDEQVRFTSVAVLADNSVYVARTGPAAAPVNQPYNAVMVFSPTGANTRNLSQLSGLRPSLLSSVNPTAVLTRVHPPQQTTFAPSLDLFVAQSPYPTLESPAAKAPLPYAVLSVRGVETPDGLLYQPDVAKLAAASGGSGLYSTYRFDLPTGLAYAADGTNYLFVVDAGKDSVFVFNNNGVEGVAPPPGARDPRPVRVSFGGTGDGPLRLRNPQGVAYYNRTVYVADTGNNRIARYRLNTDLE